MTPTGTSCARRALARKQKGGRPLWAKPRIFAQNGKAAFLCRHITSRQDAARGGGTAPSAPRSFDRHALGQMARVVAAARPFGPSLGCAANPETRHAYGAGACDRIYKKCQCLPRVKQHFKKVSKDTDFEILVSAIKIKSVKRADISSAWQVPRHPWSSRVPDAESAQPFIARCSSRTAR